MQEELFHDDEYSALSHAVSALGGAKKVGSELFPHMSPDAAGRRLLDCLNPDRNQELHPGQLLWLFKAARQVGCHSLFAYFAREAGYADPQPVEPEDEAAELQRQFIAAQQQMAQMMKRMEKLSLPQVKAVS